MRRVRYLACSSLLALSWGASITPGVAQSDAPAVRETIVVTATRRATNLYDTPIAISNASQEDLDRLNVDDVSSLNRVVPGLQIRDNSVDGQGGVDINLRGVGNSNFIETAEPNVAFNIDGVYTARPQAALQLFHDLERVEVSRGPQGTLQGRNATIGSINAITKKPVLGEYSGRLSGEYGSHNARGVQATVNVPLTDSLAVRANFSRYKRDSHTNLVADEEVNLAIEQLTNGDTTDGNPLTTVDALPIFSSISENPDGTLTSTPLFASIYGDGGDERPGSFGSEDTTAARFSALFEPNDWVEWHATYEFFRDEALGNPLTVDCERTDCERDFTPGQAAIAGPDTAFLSFRGRADLQIHNVRSNLNFDVGDLFNVRHLYGYSNVESERVSDLDFGVGIELAFADGGSLTTPFTSRSHVHDVQFTSLHDGPFQWTAGYFDFRERTSRNLFVSFFPFGQSAFPNPNLEVNTRAAYADFTYDLTDRVELFAGARYTNDRRSNAGAAEFSLTGEACAAEISNSAFSLEPGTNFAGAGSAALINSASCLVGAGTEAPESRDDFADWRAGINFNLTDDVILYGSVSTGHKAALQDQIFNLQRFQTPENPFQVVIPVARESLTNFEIGSKGRLFNDRVTFAAAAFYTDFEDKQEAQFFNFGDRFCDLNGNGVFDGGGAGGTGLLAAEGEAGCGLGFDPEPINPLQTPDLDDTFFSDVIQYAIVPADLTVWGLELEASSRIFDNGLLSGFVTYTNAEYDRFEYSHVLGCPNPNLAHCDPRDIAGNRPRSTPEVTFNGTYSHTFAVDGVGEIVPSFNLYYRSDFFLTPENIREGQISAADAGLQGTTFFDGTIANDNEQSLFADEQEGSVILNFNVRWALPNEHLSLEVFGSNLTDKRVRSSVRIDTDATPLFAFEDPREFGVRLTGAF